MASKEAKEPASLAIWQDWTKRLDAEIKERWGVVAETTLALDMTHQTTFADPELDVQSCLMIRVWIEGFMKSLEKTGEFLFTLESE